MAVRSVCVSCSYYHQLYISFLVQLVSDERHYINTVPATVSSLALFNTSLQEDTGTYSCVAENTAGIARHSVSITVTPSLCKIYMLTCGTSNCMMLYVAAPVFLTAPTSQLVSSGEVVMLMCEVEANPPANVTWLMESQVVPACTAELLNMSSACVLSDVLMIQGFSEEQEGQYSCVAGNEVGEAIAEVTLQLVPEEISENIYTAVMLVSVIV